MANTVINTPELLNLDSTTGATVLAKGTISERPLPPTISVDYLVVAGGGGGGNSSGRSGAGGAGGLLTNYTSAKITLNTGSTINFQVGAGAVNPGTIQVAGNNGENSFLNASSAGFQDITAIGGGGGGGGTSSSTANGKLGGSGGGAAYLGGSTGGAGTTGQGNSGGTGATLYAGGGGGGAGGAGGNASSNNIGGVGGVGLAVNILNFTDAGTASVGEVIGSNVFYAGGGGGGFTGSGGAGGNGGGGDGASGAGGAGTANTGGGGGGQGNNTNLTSGAGGSGVIILRYPSTFTCTVSAGENANSPFTEGNEKITVISGTGTGTVSFSKTAVSENDATDGTLRFNTDTNKTEYFDGANWYEIVDEYASGFVGPATNYFDTKLYTGNGATQSIGGYINGSGSFDGSNSAIVLPNNILSSDFSISAWFYLNSTSGNQYLFEFDYENRVLFRVASTDNNWAYIGNSGYFNPGITYNAGQWYNVVITFSNGNPFKIYVNGVLSYTSGNTSVSAFSNDNILGAANSSGSGAVNGLIDQVRIYNTTLSQLDVTALQGETAATASTAAFPSGQTAIATYTMDTSANGLLTTTDLSTVDYPSGAGCIALYEMNENSNDTSNTYNGTPTNITYQGGVFDQAAVFNGSSSKISLSTISNIKTYSFWINPDSSGNATYARRIFGNIGGTSYTYSIVLDPGFGGAGEGRMVYYDNTSAKYGDIINFNKWSHIAFTSDGTTLKIYTNGSLSNTYTTSGFVSSINEICSTSSNRQFKGSIDQVRIFDTTLSDANIATLARGIATSYSGTATNVNFNGHLDFQPGLTWVKARDAAHDHLLVDIVNGAGSAKGLVSNANYTEGTYTATYGYISSLNSNGFTVAAGSSYANYTNVNNEDYVSWNWKAGGAAVANNDGTIPSQVSANKDSGFSIATYTGVGYPQSTTAEVGHGLDSTPDIVIIKGIGGSGFGGGVGEWVVGTGHVPADPWIGGFYLSSTAAYYSSINYFWNGTPTNDVVKIKTDPYVNSTNVEYVMYSWHSVAGYSKIGSYTGNGNVSGPTITTNFEPSWVMVKRADSTGAWNIQDNKRNTTNPRNTILQANDAAGDITNTAYNINFDSTSFQIVNTGSNWNTLNGTYLYMAFA